MTRVSLIYRPTARNQELKSETEKPKSRARQRVARVHLRQRQLIYWIGIFIFLHVSYLVAYCYELLSVTRDAQVHTMTVVSRLHCSVLPPCELR